MTANSSVHKTPRVLFDLKEEKTAYYYRDLSQLSKFTYKNNPG